MEHVTKAYTDRVLLDDVAFGINENEKIGVIGINGMGKSTLLKIVAGVEEYDSGKSSILTSLIKSSLSDAEIRPLLYSISSSFSIVLIIKH